MDDSRNLIRVGIVSSLDAGSLRVRVFFPQLDNLVSDWIAVLQQPAYIATEGAYEHTHNLSIYGWMPAVNDRVLVLYAQGFSADGFVLGVIP